MSKIEVQVVIHLPFWKERGHLSNMRKIVKFDVAPRAGEVLRVAGAELTLDRIVHNPDGHMHAHVMLPRTVIEAVGEGPEVSRFANELGADGWSGVTAWDDAELDNGGA